MLGESQFVGQAASRLPAWPVTKLTPVYRDVFINQVLIEKTRFAIKVIGLPESPATKILIQNLSATTSERPIVLNDVEGFVLKNAEIKSANRTIGILDAREISFENCRFDVPEGKLDLEVAGDLSKNIQFHNCTPKMESRL
jgi:hypothetical protein